MCRRMVLPTTSNSAAISTRVRAKTKRSPSRNIAARRSTHCKSSCTCCTLGMFSRLCTRSCNCSGSTCVGVISKLDGNGRLEVEFREERLKTPDPIKARCENGHALFFLVFNLPAAATAVRYARHSIFAPAFPQGHTRPCSCYERPTQRCRAPSRPGPFLGNSGALLFFLLSGHRVPGQQGGCLPRCSRKCLHDP